MRFADTHCHLDFAEFDEDRAEIIHRCQSSSIDLLLVPSVSRGAWDSVLSLAANNRDIYVGLGLHPYFINKHQLSDIDELERLLNARYKKNVEPEPETKPESRTVGEKLLAVGEIGLDATVDAMDKQKFYFNEQLRLAEEFKLPVIVHSRKTHNEVIKAVRSRDLVGGVLHAFSGSLELLYEFTKSGLKLGVGGIITWPSATKTRKTIAQAPLESLVLETDAPDMPIYYSGEKVSGLPSERVGRSRKGTPLQVIDVFKVLCEIREESPDIIAAQLWQNAQTLFFAQGL